MRRRLLIVAADLELRARLVGVLRRAGYAPELAEPPARAHVRNNRGIALALIVPEGLGTAGEIVTAGLAEQIGPVVVLTTGPARTAAGTGTVDAADEAALLARISELLAPQAAEPPPGVLTFSGYLLDLAGETLLREDGTEVRLTPGEYRLLRAFAQRPRRVLSRDQLLQASGGGEGDADRAIDMLTMRLRRKVEADPKSPALIVTAAGSGYKFTAAVSRLDTVSAAPVPSGAVVALPGGAARRRVTVLCAELVAQAGAALPSDPEHYAALVAAHRARIGAIAACFGGVAGRSFVRTVPVYFGVPTTLEHASEWAVTAALGMVEPDLSGAADCGGCAVRVGVAAGLVVAAPDGDLLGEAPGLAMERRAQAAPGQVVIGAEVRRAVGGLFRCRAIAATLADPAGQAWQVTGGAAMPNRFRALRPDRIALVGREDELALLRRRWDRAREGDGRVVWIVGEAGIGKSRLTRALAEQVGADAALRVALDCAPHHAEQPLHPVRNFLARLAPAPRAGDVSRMDRLRHRLRLADARDPDIDLLAGLLGWSSVGPPAPLKQAGKARLFSTLLALLARLCRRRPVMLVCEDAHWADSLSLELLNLLCRDAAELPVLVLVTSRPGFAPAWADAPHVTTLKLNGLGAADTTVLAGCVAAGRALPLELTDCIFARTGGVPLFVEEFTRAVLDSEGAAERAIEQLWRGVPLDVPATLQNSLMARLDRLGWACKLAQCAAVLGRDFTRPVLLAVAGLPPDRLDAGLELLIQAQLITCGGAGEDASYSFRHALLRDAAYESIKHGDRAALHAQIANALRRDFPDMAASSPEIVAHHLTEAKFKAEAVPLWRLAGQRNIQASANLEAAAQFRRALEELPSLPPGRDRDALELDIRVELGVALTGTRGYTSREFNDNTAAALRVCERGGASARLPPVLWGMVAGAFSAGDIESARACAERFMQEAVARNDRQLRMIGQRLTGMVLFGAGVMAPAHDHLSAAAALYDADADRDLPADYGFDQLVASKAYLGRTLQALGRADEAIKACQGALAAAPEGHINSVLYAQYNLMSLHMMRNEPECVLAWARAGMRLARFHGAYNYQLVSQVVEEIAALRAGGGAAAQAAITGNLQALRDINWIYFVTRLSLVAAEVAAATDHAAQARAWCDEACALIEPLRQGACVPDLHRINAAVLRCEGAPAEAVAAALQRSLDAAKGQGARWVELRAAGPLARLLCEGGDKAAARTVLLEALRGMEQGHDLADFVTARRLLEELET